MATNRQLQFVADMEAGAKAAKLRNMQRLSIEELYELAGRSAVDGRLYIMRLAEKGETELLWRIHRVFNQFGLAPIYVKKALEGKTESKGENIDSQAIEFISEQPTDPCPSNESELQTTASRSMQLVLMSKPSVFKDAWYEIISILEPVPERHRSRLLSAVSAFYGMGG